MAMEKNITSITCKTSLMIFSVSLSSCGCTSATWSLQEIMLPRALSLSSTLCNWTPSGRWSRRCCSSCSVVVFGTSTPCRLAAQSTEVLIHVSCINLVLKYTVPIVCVRDTHFNSCVINLVLFGLSGNISAFNW